MKKFFGLFLTSLVLFTISAPCKTDAIQLTELTSYPDKDEHNQPNKFMAHYVFKFDPAVDGKRFFNNSLDGYLKFYCDDGMLSLTIFLKLLQEYVNGEIYEEKQKNFPTQSRDVLCQSIFSEEIVLPKHFQALLLKGLNCAQQNLQAYMTKYPTKYTALYQDYHKAYEKLCTVDGSGFQKPYLTYQHVFEALGPVIEQHGHFFSYGAWNLKGEQIGNYSLKTLGFLDHELTQVALKVTGNPPSIARFSGDWRRLLTIDQMQRRLIAPQLSYNLADLVDAHNLATCGKFQSLLFGAVLNPKVNLVMPQLALYEMLATLAQLPGGEVLADNLDARGLIKTLPFFKVLADKLQDQLLCKTFQSLLFPYDAVPQGVEMPPLEETVKLVSQGSDLTDVVASLNTTLAETTAQRISKLVQTEPLTHNQWVGFVGSYVPVVWERSWASEAYGEFAESPDYRFTHSFYHGLQTVWTYYDAPNNALVLGIPLANDGLYTVYMSYNREKYKLVDFDLISKMQKKEAFVFLPKMSLVQKVDRLQDMFSSVGFTGIFNSFFQTISVGQISGRMILDLQKEGVNPASEKKMEAYTGEKLVFYIDRPHAVTILQRLPNGMLVPVAAAFVANPAVSEEPFENSKDELP